MTLLADIVFMPLIAFVTGLALVLMARRARARIERRVGPPFFQPVYDIVKLFTKKTQISHGVMHDLSIVLLLGGYITAEIFLPVPGFDGLAHHGDLLTLIYIMMVPMLGLALGVGSCANPNGSIGISRALTAMLAYDVPLAVAIIGATMTYGTTDLVKIVEIQQAGGMATWGIASMPLLAIGGYLAVHGMFGKEPFEIYIAPAEIATGPMVEMSGKYMGALFIMQCFQLYTIGVLYVTLFLGGGENWPAFLLKVFAVVFVSIAVTNVYGRYKTDTVVRWMWKWPTGIGLIGLLLVMARQGV